MFVAGTKRGLLESRKMVEPVMRPQEIQKIRQPQRFSGIVALFHCFIIALIWALTAMVTSNTSLLSIF